MGDWVLCLLSIAISNSCCIALYSFFSTTLPNQENLITSFGRLLVFALTSTVNILVRRVLQKTEEKNLDITRKGLGEVNSCQKNVLFWHLWHLPD